RIRNSALSADGRLLATASDGSVIVWELPSGRRLHKFATPDRPTFSCPGLTFAPDGRHLGYVHGPNFACLCELPSEKEVFRSAEDNRGFACCRFSADSKQFALTTRERIRFHDLATRTETHTVSAEHIAHLSPDARTYVRVDERKETVLGDTQT